MIDRKKIADALREIASFYAPDPDCTNAIYNALTAIIDELDPPEPQPEPKESPIDPIERPLRNLILEAKEKGVNIRTWYQDLIFTPESLTSYLGNGKYRWWNIGNWELTKRKANMPMPEPEPPKEPKYKICTRCGGSQSVPKPEVSSTAYTACTKCGGAGFEIAEEPEIVAHKQHANCLVCGKVIEGLLDGHATVSIKRYSISSLYESTYSHYCGKCFLELGFDATERELRNRQQPIAEPVKEQFKVGDWAKYDIDSYLRVIETPGREKTLCKTLSGVIVYPYTSCLTKVSPSEVVIHIGCLSGPVRRSSSSHFCIICGDHWSMIAFAMLLDTATRELVESLLKAQEVNNG